MTTRRTVLKTMLAEIALVLVAPRAQAQPRLRRIGFLWETEQSLYFRHIAGFKTGMQELGYAEGKDYVILHRSASGNSAQLPALAGELLSSKVNVIVSSGTPSAVAAHKTSREIPILTVTASGQVEAGLAATLRRLGGNVTGLTSAASGLNTKRLDLLREIVPGMRRVGFLYNPGNSNDVLGLTSFESDCSKIALQPLRAELRKAEEIADVFDALKRDQAQGLVVSQASTNIAWRESIIQYAAKHRLPAMYPLASFGESGGLFSYGANTVDLFRRAAVYVDKIFKGAKPGDLPIERPNKFELVINLKTANYLGLTVPQSLLVQADKLIE